MSLANKETRAAPEAVHDHGLAFAMTRRRLLAGTGRIALLAALPMACTSAPSVAWADGTFWDDGLGWRD
ncbi:MAG: hypothetical protein HC871_10210 [Rhizobiales bacterium]|nr:hypothetical protein [Hyphomicrobiales bacterium]